jgi:hypothetical protein
VRLFAATAVFTLLTACGYVGPPLPPALNLPRAVNDLRAEQVGDRIVVHFTTPAKTTEDLPIAQLRAIRLYVDAEAYEIPATKLGALDHPIAAGKWAGKQVELVLRTVGVTGRESEVSNRVSISVIAPLEQPRVTTRNTADGVALTWTGNAPLFRVQRSIPADPDPGFEQIAETDKREFTDGNAADGVGYVYMITGVSGESARSLPSDPAAITPADTFAPAVPGGLTAVALGPTVDLSWTRNTESDLAGYNLFRGEDDRPLTVYAEGVALPTFADRNVGAGKRYRYAVSAVDKKGNQSGRSPEVAVRVE